MPQWIGVAVAPTASFVGALQPWQTVTSTSSPDPVIPPPDGNGSGLTIAVLAAVVLLLLAALGSRRRRFRRPRYLADSPPHAVRTVEGAWDEAVILQQGLVADRATAQSVESALYQLRRQLGDGRLTDEIKQIEYAAAQLRSNLGQAAESAGRIARRLQDD